MPNQQIVVTQMATGELKPHPKNPNIHPPEQIERLAKLLKYQGFRTPIVVSKGSGFVISGHGRLAAAKLLGLQSVPVSIQEFESYEQEYAHLVGDNAIAEWADLNFAEINAEIGNLGPDFDIECLGLEDFQIEPADKDSDDTPEVTVKKPNMAKCPHCQNIFDSNAHPADTN